MDQDIAIINQNTRIEKINIQKGQLVLSSFKPIKTQPTQLNFSTNPKCAAKSVANTSLTTTVRTAL